MASFRRSRTLPKTTAPTDDEGSPVCRWCLGELPTNRRSFCSDGCVHEWNLRTSTTYLRSQVFLRDRGKCAKCLKDMIKLKLDLGGLGPEQLSSRLDVLGITEKQYRRSLWEADHILPVAKGGGWSGLGNIQTLCIWCHRLKTRTKT